VQVRDDENLVRDGDDLVAMVTVSGPDAVLGTTRTVHTLEGDEELRIEAGTQPETVITLRGRGMPSLRRRGRGDLRVVVKVVTPSGLSSEQRSLLRRFADSLTPENLRLPEEDESLFSRVRRAFR
jgi:molecular chaperone DnaJ